MIRKIVASQINRLMGQSYVVVGRTAATDIFRVYTSTGGNTRGSTRTCRIRRQWAASAREEEEGIASYF